MFSKIRNKLTLFYSGLMILFLLSFTLISYFLLSSVLYYDKKQEIVALSKQKVDHDLLSSDKRKVHDHDDDEDDDDEDKNNDWKKDMSIIGVKAHSFYVVFDNHNRIVYAEGVNETFEKQLLKNGQLLSLKNGEIKKYEVVDDHDKIHVLATKNVHDHQTIVAGTDISAQHEILHLLLIILLALSGVFLLLAAIFSFVMSGRAMVPIARSFERQREFVADASHELRTPLSIVQSSIEVIEYEEEKHLSSFSKQVLSDMKDEVRRMTKLVSDLLTLARVDSGTIDIQKSTFSLNERLEPLIRSFQLLADKKAISVTLHAPDSLNVYADPERILQLFYILLDNAIKYTSEGGNIEMNVIQDGKDLIIEVSDSGVGISKEDQERIFDRFYRVDKARSRECGGTGLGLSIAKWIVSSHQGTIDVKSRSGEGTTFTIRLPILISNM